MRGIKKADGTMVKCIMIHNYTSAFSMRGIKKADGTMDGSAPRPVQPIPLPKGQLVWHTDHAAHVEAPPSSDPTRCAMKWTSSGVIEDVSVDDVVTSLAPCKRERAAGEIGIEDVGVDDVATSLAPRKRERAGAGATARSPRRGNA